jgi:hypothetical protein
VPRGRHLARSRINETETFLSRFSASLLLFTVLLSSHAAFAQQKPKYGFTVKENRAKFLAMPEIENKQIIGEFFNLINDSGTIMSKNHFQGILI